MLRLSRLSLVGARLTHHANLIVHKATLRPLASRTQPACVPRPAEPPSRHCLGSSDACDRLMSSTVRRRAMAHSKTCRLRSPCTPSHQGTSTHRYRYVGHRRDIGGDGISRTQIHCSPATRGAGRHRRPISAARLRYSLV
ncbi:hypothetical protein C8Q77DRAFT_177385 [Trametes polyzona]|nr:hypothetical protein C8Q77DRAFT_177385 [Trametes polyzona]